MTMEGCASDLNRKSSSSSSPPRSASFHLGSKSSQNSAGLCTDERVRVKFYCNEETRAIMMWKPLSYDELRYHAACLFALSCFNLYYQSREMLVPMQSQIDLEYAEFLYENSEHRQRKKRFHLLVTPTTGGAAAPATGGVSDRLDSVMPPPMPPGGLDELVTHGTLARTHSSPGGSLVGGSGGGHYSFQGNAYTYPNSTSPQSVNHPGGGKFIPEDDLSISEETSKSGGSRVSLDSAESGAFNISPNSRTTHNSTSFDGGGFLDASAANDCTSTCQLHNPTISGPAAAAAHTNPTNVGSQLRSPSIDAVQHSSATTAATCGSCVGGNEGPGTYPRRNVRSPRPSVLSSANSTFPRAAVCPMDHQQPPPPAPLGGNPLPGGGTRPPPVPPRSLDSSGISSSGGLANESDDLDTPEGDDPMVPGDMSQWQKGRCIGRGAYGTVRIYYNKNTGVELAVKEIQLTSRTPEKVRRSAELEVNLLKDYQHEKIVQFFGTCLFDNQLLIFMEHLPGGSVKNQLDEYGPLTEAVTKRYVVQILGGLNYLHDRHVIHRDIKCANILRDGTGNVKLSDFGCAKMLNSVMKHSGTLQSCVGSPHWMGPEVILNKPYSRKADIWSFGCTIVEMLTTRPPNGNMEPLAAAYSVVNNRTCSVQLPALGCSPHAVQLVELMLSWEQDDRPTAAQLKTHPFVLGASGSGGGGSSNWYNSPPCSLPRRRNPQNRTPSSESHFF